MTSVSCPRPPRAARRDRQSSTPVPVPPSTLWATGIEPLDPADRWPAPILTRAIGEFSSPGARVLLTAWPAPVSRGRLHLLEADTETARATVESLGRDPRSGGDESVDLVVVSLLADHLDPVTVAENVIASAADRMAAGALLVVLGRCRHSRDGVLLDPAGPVVAAAQSADLLFLQHLIAAPVAGETIPAPHPATGTGQGRHTVAHIDVFAFLLPITGQAAA
ncbi:hypothetical protein [Nocardia takedensis]|uniref:hypothetical protein n=1 Tax=Nocardia takedensis TaxID=259390 RepID=UPI0012F63960|nr:hypothetical protein [Nocardia takedensis]